MGARAVLRLAMVAAAACVIGLVVLSWKGRSEPDGPPATTPGGDAGASGAVSRTSDLQYTWTDNGVTRYELKAGERVGFGDNRSQFADVHLQIHGAARAGAEVAAPTDVRSAWLDVTERVAAGVAERFAEIRFREDVRASLPDGIGLTTDLLVSDDGGLFTDQGVLLRVGGLVVEAKEFRHDPQTGETRMAVADPESVRPDLQGGVKLWIDEEAGPDTTPAFAGRAGELHHAAGSDELRLIGGPSVELPEARLTAREIVLIFDEGAAALRRIEAHGDARALWLGSAVPGDHVVGGDLIVVELDETREPAGLRATADPDSPRPRFELAGIGTLRGDVIELATAADAAAAASASGQAYFFPASGAGGLQEIGAGVLRVGGEELERLDAEGAAEAKLRGAAGEEIALSGPRAAFVYRDGGIESAEWLAGLAYREAGRSLEAGRGSYRPETGDWHLSGAPPRAPGFSEAVDAKGPRLRSPEYDVDAEEMVLGADGGVWLSGGVEARLRGDTIRMVQPVFGEGTELAVIAASLEVSPDGRLAFCESARMMQGQQLLQADCIKLLPASGELHAEGNVLAIISDRQAASPDEPRMVELTAPLLLVESSPPRLVFTRGATLDAAPRYISGTSITVHLLDDGGWRSVEVIGQARLEDPAGSAQGGNLEYDAASGLITVLAGDGAAAVFRNDEGIEIRDPLGLQLRWGEDMLEVKAMQMGTTQTVRQR
jgi:hypothetical protein